MKITKSQEANSHGPRPLNWNHGAPRNHYPSTPKTHIDTFFFLFLQQKDTLLPMKITRKGSSEPNQDKQTTSHLKG
jgi:hypothetical protein